MEGTVVTMLTYDQYVIFKIKSPLLSIRVRSCLFLHKLLYRQSTEPVVDGKKVKLCQQL